MADKFKPDKLKGLAKGGWHPGGQKDDPYDYGKISRDGGKPAWQKNFKGADQIAKLTGHGGKGSKSDYNADSHQSAPLSSLKDPSLFGPPPKRTGTADSLGSGPSSPAHAPSTPSRTTASRGGWGAPISQDHVHAQRAREEQEQREAEEEAERQANAPPVPYRPDTTGLSTAGFAPPPKFRGNDAAESTSSRPAPAAAARPTPSLPPRLPARSTETPPPSYDEVARPDEGVMNQGSLNRLGQAGVNVPGLGIGGDKGASRPVPAPPPRHHGVTPPGSAHSDAPASPSTMGHGGQLNELQARFARMGGNKATDAPTASPTSPDVPVSPTKKKPPPPPPKKKELHGHEVGQEPPPIPMASKPR